MGKFATDQFKRKGESDDRFHRFGLWFSNRDSRELSTLLTPRVRNSGPWRPICSLAASAHTRSHDALLTASPLACVVAVCRRRNSLRTCVSVKVWNETNEWEARRGRGGLSCCATVGKGIGGGGGMIGPLDVRVLLRLNGFLAWALFQKILQNKHYSTFVCI